MHLLQNSHASTYEKIILIKNNASSTSILNFHVLLGWPSWFLNENKNEIDSRFCWLFFPYGSTKTKTKINFLYRIFVLLEWVWEVLKARTVFYLFQLHIVFFILHCFPLICRNLSTFSFVGFASFLFSNENGIHFRPNWKPTKIELENHPETWKIFIGCPFWFSLNHKGQP